MQARESFHKAANGQIAAALGVLALGLISATCGRSDVGSSDGDARAVVAERAQDRGPVPPPGHAWVIFGADTVVAEVAATAEEREEGLMYRDEVPDGTGMLFVFTDNRPRAFWMANTYVALDIAYMDPSFRVVDIVAMEPLVTDSYPSQAPAMYGLEVRQGWFEENGIEVGAQAEVVFGAPRR